MPIPSNNPIKPLGLGEIVLRVANLQSSLAFYCDLLGFTLIRVLHDAIAFVRVADGVEGHTQIIGLFSKDWQPSREGQMWDGWSSTVTTLHHFAIEISLAEHHKVFEHLSKSGLKPNAMIHAWIGWRSIYVSDPDNNTLEFVSYDRSVLRHTNAAS